MTINKSILIGIAGGTGSGKTSVAKALASEFGQSEVILIEQDSYYKDLRHLEMEDRVKVNFDHPDAVDFLLLKAQLELLISGQGVDIPIYDYTTHTRKEKTNSIDNHHIILLEGILALLDEEIRELMDIKLYVDTPDDIRIIRRISRDINERSRSYESVVKQYFSTVRPMHEQFVEPTKKFADIIIPEGGQNKVAIDVLRTKIISLLPKSESN